MMFCDQRLGRPTLRERHCVPRGAEKATEDPLLEGVMRTKNAGPAFCGARTGITHQRATIQTPDLVRGFMSAPRRAIPRPLRRNSNWLAVYRGADTEIRGFIAVTGAGENDRRREDLRARPADTT